MRGALILMLALIALPAGAEDYRGGNRLWFTLASLPMQASGSAGRAAGMERFPLNRPDLTGLRTECYGSADERGLGKGHCLTFAPDGALWVEAYVCDEEVLPPAGTIAACSGRSTVLGGTGRFAAITGGGDFTMLTTMIAPDGMRVIFAPGEMRLHW